MRQSALSFLALLFSIVGISQNPDITDSLDRVIKKDFKRTTRIDDQRDSTYSMFFYNKENKNLLVAIVSSKQSEITYNFINDQLIRVRIVVQFAGEFTRGVAKYYFLNNTLANAEESGIQTQNPLEYLLLANKILVMAKAKIQQAL